MAPSQPGPKGRFRFAPSLRLEESLSLAAFLMSLSITLINVYYSFRGSEVAVDAPAQLILYRDGSGDASVLTAAVRLEMINVSDGYGDVLKDASISLGADPAAFDFQGTVRTVLANDASGKSPECDLGLRCLDLPGLFVIERSDEILETPAGAARAFNLAFPLVSWNCAGQARRCARFDTFGRSLRAIPANGVTATVRLRFHSDGERTLSCATGSLNLAYLEKVGWLSVPCANKERA